MKAMILAAGLGTRLRPLTNHVSKPMVQMAGRPCMEYTVRLLQKAGFKDIVVNLHYLPEQIREYFGDGSRFGVRMTYSYEAELMGTAGGFKRVEHFFGDETALIISGDALTDIDLPGFLAFHRECGGIATLALKQVTDPAQYGVVVMDDSRITRFQEKPQKEEAISNLANTGIYLFEPEIFRLIPENTFFDFARDVFPLVLARGDGIFGYTMDGYWCDVGNLEVYREAHYDMLAGKVNVELPGKLTGGRLWAGENVSVHEDAQVVGPALLGDNCVISAGARIIGPVVLGKNTVVGANAVIKRGILWDNVNVGEGANLADTVIGGSCQIPADLVLHGEVLDRELMKTVAEAAAAKE